MSKQPKNEDREISIQKSSKQITRGIIANFLFNYGTLPVNFIITWSITKNFASTLDLLSIFTYSFVFVQGAQLFLLFIPPSIGSVLNIRIPEHIFKGEYSTVKGIIRYVLLIKLIASIIMCVAYAGIGISLIFASDSPIQGIGILIFSPFIIIEEIRKVFLALFQGLKKFMTRFYLFFLQKLLLLVGYLIIFYGFSLSEEIEVYVILVWNIIVIIPSVIVYFFLYRKMFKKYKHIPVTWQNIKDTAKYGLNFTIIASIQMLSNQINYGILKSDLDNPNYVNEYNLANNLVSQSFGAFNMPLTPILVDFHVSNRHRDMMRLFKKSTYFVNLILALLTGVVIYLSELYVLVIYTPEFMPFVPLLRFFVVIIYFENWVSNYHSLYSATQLHKRMVIIKIISFLFTLVISVISYLIWGFPGFIIAITIGRIVNPLLFWADAKFVLKKFALSLWDVLQHFIICALILLVNYLLFQLIDLIPMNWLINPIERIFGFIGVDLHNQISIVIDNGIQVFTFLILFAIYVILFRAITKQDIGMLENAKLRIPFKKFLMKILKDKKKNGFWLPV